MALSVAPCSCSGISFNATINTLGAVSGTAVIGVGSASVASASRAPLAAGDRLEKAGSNLEGADRRNAAAASLAGDAREAIAAGCLLLKGAHW